MNTKGTVFLLLCSATLFMLNIPLMAFAATDSDIESGSGSELIISGKVVMPSCTVAPDTVNGDVDLGKVQSERLRSAGSTSDWSDFSLTLTECPVTTTKVVVHFTGTPDPDYPVYFKNTGSSEHVAVEVADDTGARISNSAERTVVVNSEQQAKIDLKGRMASPQGEATSGTVSGIMDLSFDFQ